MIVGKHPPIMVPRSGPAAAGYFNGRSRTQAAHDVG
jgi:hypothetical protein